MAKRVLIADDSSNTRTILRFMLQNQGFEIVEAENGEEALAKARAHSPNIIVLDGMMPKKSGFEACRELKEDPKTSAIPVILLTAIAQTDPSRDWSKDSAADKFMAKPFRMNDLLTAIEQLLGISTSSATAQQRLQTLDPDLKGTVIRPSKLG